MPVYNGLTDDWHPTQMLADVLTMTEHCDKPLGGIAFAYLGDARFNMGNSYLVTGALLGMDVRIVAPQAYWPAEEIVAEARKLAESNGGRVTLHRAPRRGRPRRRLRRHRRLGLDGQAQEVSSASPRCPRTP